MSQRDTLRATTPARSLSPYKDNGHTGRTIAARTRHTTVTAHGRVVVVQPAFGRTRTPTTQPLAVHAQSTGVTYPFQGQLNKVSACLRALAGPQLDVDVTERRLQQDLAVCRRLSDVDVRLHKNPRTRTRGGSAGVMPTATKNQWPIALHPVRGIVNTGHQSLRRGTARGAGGTAPVSTAARTWLRARPRAVASRPLAVVCFSHKFQHLHKSSSAIDGRPQRQATMEQLHSSHHR